MLHKICNGPYCNGETLSIDRFSKDKSCNAGVRTFCKMCVFNKNKDNFIPGKCEKCGIDHDCSFGPGRFCSRSCATNKKPAKSNISDKNIKIRKKCTSDTCYSKGKLLPIKNFYLRSGGTQYRSRCKVCEMEYVRKNQTTLKGYIKNSVNSARRRSKYYDRSFDIDYKSMKNYI